MFKHEQKQNFSWTRHNFKISPWSPLYRSPTFVNVLLSNVGDLFNGGTHVYGKVLCLLSNTSESSSPSTYKPLINTMQVSLRKKPNKPGHKNVIDRMLVAE